MANIVLHTRSGGEKRWQTHFIVYPVWSIIGRRQTRWLRSDYPWAHRPDVLREDPRSSETEIRGRFIQLGDARACRVSNSTIGEYVERAKQAGLNWPLPEELGEEELYWRLFGEKEMQRNAWCRTGRRSATQVRADGSLTSMLRSLARTSLLVLDDWMRDAISIQNAQDILAVLDDRFGYTATLIATQVPIAEWHRGIPDLTLADAILDRLVHNAHRIELKGESQRKIRAKRTMANP